jgi:hypothetical protein
MHRVGTIGDASLNQAVLCQISVARRLVFGHSDATASANAVHECVARLHGVARAEYTDISGALKYASLALQGNSDAARHRDVH